MCELNLTFWSKVFFKKRWAKNVHSFFLNEFLRTLWDYIHSRTIFSWPSFLYPVSQMTNKVKEEIALRYTDHLQHKSAEIKDLISNIYYEQMTAKVMLWIVRSQQMPIYFWCHYDVWCDIRSSKQTLSEILTNRLNPSGDFSNSLPEMLRQKSLAFVLDSTSNAWNIHLNVHHITVMLVRY